MQSLTVLYDARCPLCCRARAWLAQEPAYLPLYFIAAGSDEAMQRFPALDHTATLREITVVGDGGEVYYGAKAWLICLWALRDYRAWSLRLSTPELLPTVKGFVHWVAENRFRLSGAHAPADADPADCTTSCAR